MTRHKTIEVRWHDEIVGYLSETSERLSAFEYCPEFLANGTSISPFELPLKPGLFIAKPTPFNGGFGVFDDSLPDGWGLLILDRYLRKKGIDPGSLTLLQRLSLVGSAGRGALEFFPDDSFYTDRENIDFHILETEAAQILRSEDYNGEGVDQLYKRGGSPGGARPKVFVKHEGKELLVKFPALQDPANIGKIEYEYSLLAKKCGIEMPETRLIEGKYFASERFDRVDGGKIHAISIAGLLRADYRLPSIDYSHIFKVVRALTRNEEEVKKVYRLMVFNYLIDNKDDHAKNFMMLNDGERWRLAPGYDLLPGGGINGYRTTSINDSIEPTDTDLIAAGVAAGLSLSFCRSTLSRMQEIIC